MGEKIETLKRFYEVWDSHDRAALADICAELCSPDLELQQPLATVRGRDQVVAFWHGFQAAFPDARHVVVASAEQGGMVAVEGRFVGTHGGPLPAPDGSEIPATGKRVDEPYAHLLWFEDGRIARMHVYFDSGAFMAALGLVPEPAAA
jgi:ketosteroid isomerase-like protein